MNRRIRLTSHREKELDRRVSEHLKGNYKLKSRGVHKSSGMYTRTKYWAVLELNDSSEK